MLRSRLLLQKAAAEASKAAKDVAKAGASASPSIAPRDDSPSSTVPPKPLYIPLYHHAIFNDHTQPCLLEPTRPGSASYVFHHISSALGAVVSLCTSQESRDRFLELTGTGRGSSDTSNDDNQGEYSGSIINTIVLGQSDMGFLSPLALFEDLNNPLFERNPEFNIYDFMNGCGWALQQFHQTKDRLVPKLPNIPEEELRSMLAPAVKEKFDQAFLKFLETARKDPDSVECLFLTMTTPEMIEIIKADSMMHLLIGVNSPLAGTSHLFAQDHFRKFISNFTLIEEDTKVMNVALLNARVEEIYPPASLDQIQNIDNDPNKPLEDDSLMPDNGHNLGDKPQVVAQLEVLYELQLSHVNNEDGKVHTNTQVMVGKFETCLYGDPNGGNGLQWRIASFRPAIEFQNNF